MPCLLLKTLANMVVSKQDTNNTLNGKAKTSIDCGIKLCYSLDID